jgi:short chain dehydrogenase
MDLGFPNAAAVVVGGGRGMGLAAARCIAEDGARVAVVSRSRDDLEVAVDDLTERGSPEAVGLVADIRNDGAVAGFFEALDERWGELNVLVNAVGPSVQGTVDNAHRRRLASGGRRRGAGQRALRALGSSPPGLLHALGCGVQACRRRAGSADRFVPPFPASAGRVARRGQDTVRRCLQATRTGRLTCGSTGVEDIAECATDRYTVSVIDDTWEV